jgi:hypothetical protein
MSAAMNHIAALFSATREFCQQLYAAHGGATLSLSHREKTVNPAQLLALANRFESSSPSLSAELRNLASGG